QSLRAVIEAIAEIAQTTIHESLTSGAALLRINDGNRTRSCPDLRTQLARQRIVASEPLTGLVRLAMPDVPLTEAQTRRLRQALATFAATNPRPRRPPAATPFIPNQSTGCTP